MTKEENEKLTLQVWAHHNGYEKGYRDALDDFAKELKDYVYREKINGNDPYWSVAIDNVKSKLAQ